MEEELANLRALLDYALGLSTALRGRPCTRVQEEASGFLHKQSVHAYTIWQILNPIYRRELTSLSKQRRVL